MKKKESANIYYLKIIRNYKMSKSKSFTFVAKAMKKYSIIVFAIALLFFSSCVNYSVRQLKVDCKPTTEETMNKIIQVLMQQGFTIRENDVKIGLLQAENTAHPFMYSEVRKWSFQIVDNKVIAQASFTTTTKTAYGDMSNPPRYCNDGVSESLTWYWTVRNQLEVICGNQIVFIEN